MGLWDDLSTQLVDKAGELGSAAIGRVTPDTQVDLGGLLGQTAAKIPAAPSPQEVQSQQWAQPWTNYTPWILGGAALVVLFFLFKRR